MAEDNREKPFKDYFCPLANLSTSSIQYPRVTVRSFELKPSVLNCLPAFYSLHKTNAIRREILEFAQREDEQFFEAWERFNGLLLKCPHHGFEKWHQCQ